MTASWSLRWFANGPTRRNHYISSSRVLIQLSLIGALSGCVDTSSSATSEQTQQSVPSVATDCGKAGLADCPLQAWMKANPQAFLKAGDTMRLAAALDVLAEHEPSGFAGWTDSARRAARVAREGDLESARVDCKRCHDELRSRFRKELRGKALF